jgi:hypothetical protein
VKRRVSPKALETMKERVREMTSRTRGRSLESVAEELRGYLLGWKQYFHLADTPKVFRQLDEWLRHRLRAPQLKQWKRGTTVYRELRARGTPEHMALRVAANPPLAEERGHVPPTRSAHELLRPAGSPETCQLTSTYRTAGCGPACPVVWQGSSEATSLPPMPISGSVQPRRQQDRRRHVHAALTASNLLKSLVSGPQHQGVLHPPGPLILHRGE